ncbi:Fungal specific transcription factor [Drechmeria coniospora]|uniref:Fungal specific transcription factor n=1 Tax=Drechmeria coniospora TaxID=98403 RepID=A0A151GKS4_DRECN|nr:Fungal specific transcription factor [Drechmeria coniospora]KYK57689.1 Fungal specific transcription factor [Drechmeria coniospora]
MTTAAAAVEPVDGTSVDAETDSPVAENNRPACTECQRRKQKRRKVADECRYNDSNPPPMATASDDAPSQEPQIQDQAKAGTGDWRDAPPSISAGRSDASCPSEDDTPWFDVLASARVFSKLGLEPSRKPSKVAPKEDFAAAGSSPQMDRVLQLLPQRQQMDKLMKLFVKDVNYHYYIIFPQDLFYEYHIWWERRMKNKPVTLQFTCLLAMICSCCIQHADNEMQHELQQISGLDSDTLSEQLHSAVRELASVIPIGHYHIFNVQRLLQSCYWYKAEASFLEAWQVLSAAILEAKELEFHKEPPPGSESEHDCEMRRRLWCILDTWDWQISSGLSRPKIIDRADCDAALPSLTLETFPGNPPSPLLHMKMQSELTRRLADRFSAPKNIINTAEVREYQSLIEDWVRQFPRVYDVENPDTSKDDVSVWVVSHRYYLYTMACLLILNPIRHYMVKSYTWESPPEELEVRQVGVDYSLKLMDTMRSWVDRIDNRDGRLHFIIFSIFDTAAILCTAIIKDHEHTLQRKDAILASISDGVAMLERLNSISKTSKTSYDLLQSLAQRLPQSIDTRPKMRRKKVKTSSVITSKPAPPSMPPLPQVPPPVVDTPAAMPPAHVQPPAVVDATATSAGPDFAQGSTVSLPVPRLIYERNLATAADARKDNNTYAGYSTCLEGNHPDMDLLSSAMAGDGVHGFSQPVVYGSTGFPPPPVDDEPPNFELETVTQDQLGGLAPLWSWHSENLGIGCMPAPASAPVSDTSVNAVQQQQAPDPISHPQHYQQMHGYPQSQSHA